MTPGRACECTCEAWGHSPTACRGDAPCTLTVEHGPLSLWPGANVGEFRLCPACRRELLISADRLKVWDMNIESYGHPTYDMFLTAEYEKLRARLAT